MIEVKQEDDSHFITARTVQPTVYMDHWALRFFSSNKVYREKFFRIFKARGTFFVSWSHIFEVAANEGQSVDEIKSFLEEIGEQWCPLEFNPIRIMERKKNPNSLCTPAFGESFLREYYPHIYENLGPLSLTTAVDLVQDPKHRDKNRATTKRLKAEMMRVWEQAKEQWQSSPEAQKQAFRSGNFDRQFPTKYIHNKVMGLLMKERSIKENDVIDYLHAVPALAHADLVFLDPKWVDIARRLNLPTNHVLVFGKSDLDDFLAALEHIKIAP